MKSNNDFSNMDNDDDNDDERKNSNFNRAPVNIFSGQVKEPTVESIVTTIDLNLLENDNIVKKNLDIQNLYTVPTQFDVFKLDF